jgi:hypothetical protein
MRLVVPAAEYCASPGRCRSRAPPPTCVHRNLLDRHKPLLPLPLLQRPQDTSPRQRLVLQPLQHSTASPFQVSRIQAPKRLRRLLGATKRAPSTTKASNNACAHCPSYCLPSWCQRNVGHEQRPSLQLMMPTTTIFKMCNHIRSVLGFNVLLGGCSSSSSSSSSTAVIVLYNSFVYTQLLLFALINRLVFVSILSLLLRARACMSLLTNSVLSELHHASHLL